VKPNEILVFCKTFVPFGINNSKAAEKLREVFELKNDSLEDFGKECRIDGISDRDLIEDACSGNAEAFGELVRRHRNKVYQWAQKITRDHFVAEEVVQDAFIRAFLHVGTIMDTNRFLPWIYRIVQNQAKMTLRRGGPYGKESPLSSYEIKSSTNEVNCSDLDSIFNFVTKSTGHLINHNEPLEQMMRKEILDTIKSLLPCLKKREREVFEAYFFDQFSPQEIAELFSMTTGNVYTTLHRSKVKIQQDHLRTFLSIEINRRRKSGNMRRRIIEKSPIVDLYKSNNCSCWTTIATSIFGMLKYTSQKNVSLVDVMGLTSLAFRININLENVDLAGPTAFDWKTIFKKGLLNLGVESTCIGSNNFEPPTAEMLTNALQLIHDTIDRGMPVIAWDLFIPEFGLIYGYDDDRMLFHAMDVVSENTIPYTQLGRRKISELFVLTYRTENRIDPINALRDALEMILNHANGDEPKLIHFVNGLAAYDTWIELFKKKSIDVLGNAYNLAVITNARMFAFEFLKEMKEKTNDKKLFQLFEEAHSRYLKVFTALATMCELFPFPSGGKPDDPLQIGKAIELLTKAKKEEEYGIAILNDMYNYLCVNKITI
jgi:RNA polymerase sigma factor (sigma-70 family)